MAVTLLLFAQWSMPTLQSLDRGIYGGDSLWYHLPLASDFARIHSTTTLHFLDPLYLNWFYPQNSELIGGLGIQLYGNDFLSPLMNLGWLALALLAAWCIGRPYGNGAISLTAVAILLAADLMFSRQPGNANNDVVGLALLLAAVAFLVEAHTRDKLGDWAPLSVAGLAAGLALGTKLTFLVPVAALAVGAVAIARGGSRLRAALAFGVPMLAGGGFWFARNVWYAHNPIPWQKLGPIPRSEALEGRDPFSIAHYATDSSVWRHYFFPGLDERFGDFWPALLVLGVVVLALIAWRGNRMTRMLALVAAASTVAYVFTPLSASGPEGAPLGFRLNLRYLAPAMGIALAMLAVVPTLLPRKREGRRSAVSIGIFAVLAAILLFGHSPLAALNDGHLIGAIVLALGVAASIGIFRAAAVAGYGASHQAIITGWVLLVLAFLAVGWPAERDYEKQRYALDAPGYPTTQHPASELEAGLGDAYEWARGVRGEKIALGGTTGAFFQYGLYGPDSSNRVDYIGLRGALGSFDEVPDCQIWRTMINEGGYRFVVTTPGYDQDMPAHQIQTRFARWTATDPAATAILRKSNVTIFEIDGPLDPARCE